MYALDNYLRSTFDVDGVWEYMPFILRNFLKDMYASFCVSTMVKIFEISSGLMAEITDYRGIRLSSLLSKIFDNCIMSNQYHSLPMMYNLRISQKLLQLIVQALLLKHVIVM